MEIIYQSISPAPKIQCSKKIQRRPPISGIYLHRTHLRRSSPHAPLSSPLFSSTHVALLSTSPHPLPQSAERVSRKRKMRLIGLTGGIASGKSTVSDLFKSNGIPVVDADLIARDAVRKGTGGWKRVAEAFGSDILLEDGEIDRARLGQLVFSDPTKRQLLSRLLAPFITRGISFEILKLWLKGYEVIVLDIPLLFEAKLDKWTKPVIVVWVDPDTQLKRLMARDAISADFAESKIASQAPLDAKKEKADIIIDNSGSRDDTKAQFGEVLREVTRPLNWKEASRSRNGVIWIAVSGVLGALILHRHLR